METISQKISISILLSLLTLLRPQEFWFPREYIYGLMLVKRLRKEFEESKKDLDSDIQLSPVNTDIRVWQLKHIIKQKIQDFFIISSCISPTRRAIIVASEESPYDGYKFELLINVPEVRLSIHFSSSSVINSNYCLRMY